MDGRGLGVGRRGNDDRADNELNAEANDQEGVSPGRDDDLRAPSRPKAYFGFPVNDINPSHDNKVGDAHNFTVGSVLC